MLVLATASLANATVIDAVILGEGSLGHAGTSTDPLVPSETIQIGLVLNYNPNPSPPPKDGYLLSSIDLGLHVSGPGTMDAGYWYSGYPIWRKHSNFSLFGVMDAYNTIPWDDISGGLDQISGAAMTPVNGSVDGLLMWDLWIHCDGFGDVIIDLTVNGLTEYSPYSNIDGTQPKPDPPGWVAMVDDDLGDLVIHQIPEPTTVALLGLGSGLLLRRRSRKK